jgi:hypothetical protein
MVDTIHIASLKKAKQRGLGDLKLGLGAFPLVLDLRQPQFPRDKFADDFTGAAGKKSFGRFGDGLIAWQRRKDGSEL